PARRVVHLIAAPPAAGEQDGAEELNPAALESFADERVEQIDGGGDHPGPGNQGEDEAGAVAAAEGEEQERLACGAVDDAAVTEGHDDQQQDGDEQVILTKWREPAG